MHKCASLLFISVRRAALAAASLCELPTGRCYSHYIRDGTDGACSTDGAGGGGNRNPWMVLVGKPEGGRPL